MIFPRYLHMWAWLIMDYVVKEVSLTPGSRWQRCLIDLDHLADHHDREEEADHVDQVHEDGSGHWECSLISNMFLCGELKERNLTLCYVPAPIFRIFKFFFGEKT